MVQDYGLPGKNNKGGKKPAWTGNKIALEGKAEVREIVATNGKGCDIGYALAAASCEGANNVDACTVTALDVITAFAVPNPNFSSQSGRFFQVRMLVELPLRADHSAYFGLAKFYLSQPFQPSTRVTLNICLRVVNAAFQCKI